MPRLRRGESLWLHGRKVRAGSRTRARRASPRRPGDHRRRHHRLRRRAPAGIGGCAGRVDRGGANRPRQHRRQHGAADAGARRRFRGSCRPPRRVRGAPGLGSQPAGCPELDPDVEAAARCAAGRGASLDLLHAARGTGGRAEEGTGGATSGRDCRRVADGGGTTANGWFRRSRRDPHPRQRAGRSVRRLYGFRSRGPAGRRTAARALEGARHPAAWRRRRGRYRRGRASPRRGW